MQQMNIHSAFLYLPLLRQLAYFRSMYRFLIISCLFLSRFFSANAQLNVGIGAEVGFPLMFNKNVGSYNHSLGSPGLRATVSYATEQSAFIPALVVSMASIQLPVVRIIGENVLHMDFTSYNAMLSARRRILLDKKEIQFGGGIGVSYLKGNGVGINGKDMQITQIVQDSTEFINVISPMVHVTAEYIFPISSQVPLYAGIGAQIQYTYFLDKQQIYRVDIVDERQQYYTLQPELQGHMLNPSVFLSVYYRFGNRNNY